MKYCYSNYKLWCTRIIPLDWFRDYLFERKQYIVLNERASTPMELKHGVPQGSVLDPLLFLIYTNDMPHSLKFTLAIMFADDSTIYELFLRVNSDLTLLDEWYKANKYTVMSRVYALYASALSITYW